MSASGRQSLTPDPASRGLLREYRQPHDVHAALIVKTPMGITKSISVDGVGHIPHIAFQSDRR